MTLDSYHHGQTIKEHRLKRGMSQATLAEYWPGGAKTIRYVQYIEAGEKHIDDQQTLRALSDILEIPLWRFGLSEYNPFSPQNLPGRGERMLLAPCPGQQLARRGRLEHAVVGGEDFGPPPPSD